MPAITLKAHFDGESIQLDEPFPLPNNAQLLVTVLLPSVGDDFRSNWAELSANGLARAFRDDEPEYSAANVL